MKRIATFFAAIIGLFLLFSLPDSVAFAQSIEGLDRESCRGVSVSLDGGLYRRLTTTCRVTSVKAGGVGDELYKEDGYVTPTTTTEYHVVYTDNGVNGTLKVTIAIIEPPTLKIQLQTPVPADGFCEDDEVKVKVVLNSGKLTWNVPQGTEPVKDEGGNVYSYRLQKTCRIWAQSNNVCGFMDTALDFLVNTKPVLEKINLELKPELAGDFCVGCGFFPKLSDFLVTPADITLESATVTWADNSTDEVSLTSAGVFSKQATIHATVAKENSCGSASGNIDTTFTLKLRQVADCSPTMRTSVSLKPCEDREVYLENAHKGSCSITTEPTLTTSAPGNKLVYSKITPFPYVDAVDRYRWNVRWEDFSAQDAPQSLHVTAPYTIACPYGSTKNISKVYEEDIRVLADTSYLSFKYEYCPDNQAELTIEGKENVVSINSVELISPDGGFTNLFNERSESKPHKKVYETKTSITQSNVDAYAPLRLKVQFKVDEGNCHFTMEREETVQLRQKGNCNMSLSLTQSGKCIGESRTLRLSNAPGGLRIDRMEVSGLSGFAIKASAFTAGSDELEFSPYYAGAPTLTSKKDSIEATVYYHMDGSNQTLTWTKRLEMTVEACPPYFNGRPLVSNNAGSAMVEQNCPICSGVEFRGTVVFDNKTTDKDKTVVDFVSTAPNKPTAQEAWSRTGTEYNMRRYLFGDMDYHISVRYNEGDSMYMIPVLKAVTNVGGLDTVNNRSNVAEGAVVTFSHFGMATICGLVKEPVPDSVCQGDEVDLYVYSQNLYDTLKSIEWKDPAINKVGSGLEDYVYKYPHKNGTELTRQIKRFHYRVQAQAPGVYPFTITSKIRDSIVVRYDTIRIAVLDKPRIFIQDTVYACEHDVVDLNDYVNTSIIQSVDNPSGLLVGDAAGFEKRVANATLRYQCSSTGSTIRDSIFIRAENPVYNIFIPDEEFCPGDSVKLQAGTNGRITWIRRQQVQGGGFAQPDTLLVNASNSTVIYDTMGYTDCLYTVIARTACATPPSLLVQFRAVSKAEPAVQILDRSACRPEPLFLQTKPFDAAEVDSAHDVKWYVNGSEYSLPSVPPAESVQVVCKVKGLNGCYKSDTIELHSYAAPQIRIGVDGVADFQGHVYCAENGGEVRFTAQGADSYEWSLRSSGTNVSSATEYTLRILQDDTLYLTGKEKQHNCSTRDSVSVYLKPLAQVTNDTIGCNGDTLELHPVAEQEVGYTWYKPDGSECPCRSITFAPYEPRDTGVYRIRFTRKDCEVTKDVHLRMYPVPEFGFTNSIFCEDELLSLDVQTGLDDQWKSSSRFVWYGKDGDTLQDKVEQSAYEGSALSLSDAGIYHIEIYVDRCLNEDSVWVQVDAHSHPSFTVDSFYCEGATLSTQAVDQGEGSIYRWYSKNRLPSEGVSNKIALEGLTIEDSTWLTLEIERGACVDDTSVFVHVRSLPIAKIVAQGTNGDADGTYYCEGMPISLFVDGMRSEDSMSWYHQRVLQEGFASDRYSIKESKLADSGWYAFYVNRNGCTGKDSLYVDIRVVPVPLVNDTFMCSGKTLVVNASNPLFPGSTFIWEPSNTTGEQFDITAGGTYTVRMRYNGCEGDSTFTVEERPTPQIDFPDEATICQRDSIILTGPDGMEIYLWQDGSSQQTYVVTTEGLYTLYVEMAGCSDYREVMVHEDFCSNLYFPSAFTPNGDGHNDRFGPITTAEDDQVVYSLYIYNRNGEKVFETHSLKDSWDGTFKGEKCPAGIYVYQCKAHAKQNGRNLSEKGTLNLLR